jgi:hypothetical protein
MSRDKVVASDTRPDLSTRRASAESMSVTRDEDRNPRRGGSLERDQPTSPPIETLERPRTACSHADAKRRRGDEASAPSRRGGGNPWRAENPRRGSAPIVRGNTRRPEYGLPIRAETPEGALETGHVLAHDAVTTLSREGGKRTTCGDADNGAG